MFSKLSHCVSKNKKNSHGCGLIEKRFLNNSRKHGLNPDSCPRLQKHRERNKKKYDAFERPPTAAKNRA